MDQLDSHFRLVRLMVGFFVSSLAGRWISQFKVVARSMHSVQINLSIVEGTQLDLSVVWGALSIILFQ